MAKKRKRRRPSVPTTEYADADGNVLTLRQALTPGTIAKIEEAIGRPGASAEGSWRRRQEILFERLAVRWEIAGLPLTEQAMLLGRYRLASQAEQTWVRETLDAHLERFLPELVNPAG